MILNKLQTAIYLELKEAGEPLHGYEILKRIHARGLRFMHQQLYRDLHRMPLNSHTEPIQGKPDRILYALPDKSECQINTHKLDVDFLTAYPVPSWIKDKLTEIDATLTALSKRPLSFNTQFKLNITHTERDTLTSIL
ncbi:PadR family transcriptional regulator [Vibrio coralliilyticus]|uniref:PadR family transcriptional regulator n=1 Tax=Vibrio coralliilyticus TaxID=190893 RepID=UPI0017B855EF|nr:PadR family transcriptional regulator [Vibrio coralliilyticus]NUW66922.1 PadR family transcriptional regulator [Vibrio coralliilyticus]NUW70892.1 PadR family transcriptional regulator [Vibrio coralliilyticus]